MFDFESVRRSFPTRLITWSETTTSTMKDAALLSQQGGGSGSVVGAEHQSAGQGRLGRRWHSESGSGVYFTILLRLNLVFTDLPVLTLAIGLAVASAVRDVTGLHCDLKWPNDLMLNGKKCCGILSEFQEGVVLVGIGLNVNQSSFPEPIDEVATSLLLAGGVTYNREQLLIRILQEIDDHVELLESRGRAPLLDLFSQTSSYVSGKRVEVEQAGRLIRGATDGLSEAGFLFVRSDEGERVLILAGGLRAI